MRLIFRIPLPGPCGPPMQLEMAFRVGSHPALYLCQDQSPVSSFMPGAPYGLKPALFTHVFHASMLPRHEKHGAKSAKVSMSPSIIATITHQAALM